MMADVPEGGREPRLTSDRLKNVFSNREYRFE